MKEYTENHSGQVKTEDQLKDVLKDFMRIPEVIANNDPYCLVIRDGKYKVTTRGYGKTNTDGWKVLHDCSSL